MSKWRVVRGINPTKYDAIIDAACRYMNSAKYPSLDELSAVIGLEAIEEPQESTDILLEGDE